MIRDAVDRLRDRLHRGDTVPHSRIAPALSYGRHRGPGPVHPRLSAVAIALADDVERPYIPLTRRPRSLTHHGGQICFPGGRIESDESSHRAALREFEEELGLRPEVTETLGELPVQSVYASENLVWPIVFRIRTPKKGWLPDPVEVDAIIEMPLDVILDESSRQDRLIRRPVRRLNRTVGELAFRARGITWQDHFVWGATGMMLDQVAQMMKPPPARSC